MSLILASIKVSFLAMGVIFLVLGILIGVVNLMVHFIPYTAPPSPAPRAKAPAAAPAAGPSQDEDHIAAIHAALAHHLGRAPQDIHIQNITAL
ncbi:MAG: OadG family transporter subunit [Nitrospinota bacterium]|nr:OadG family transporter subunit [Nitrospinota bacterium]